MTHQSELAKTHLHRDGKNFKDKVKLCSQENQGKLQSKKINVKKIKIKVKQKELIDTKNVYADLFFSDGMNIF